MTLKAKINIFRVKMGSFQDPAEFLLNAIMMSVKYFLSLLVAVSKAISYFMTSKKQKQKSKHKPKTPWISNYFQ